MLDFTIVVTADSFNIKHELRNYIWNDKKSSTPLDADKHGIDGLRYSSMRLLEGSLIGLVCFVGGGALRCTTFFLDHR